MNFLIPFSKTPRRILGFVFLISALALGGGYTAEYFFGIKPCVLCLYQRYVYMSLMFFALVGGFLNLRAAVLLCALGFLAGSIIAFYQVGVEQHIFELPSICKTSFSQGSVAELKAHLMQKQLIPCDKVSWSLLGISMAGYNAFFSLCLAGGIYLLYRMEKGA